MPRHGILFPLFVAAVSILSTSNAQVTLQPINVLGAEDANDTGLITTFSLRGIIDTTIYGESRPCGGFPDSSDSEYGSKPFDEDSSHAIITYVALPPEVLWTLIGDWHLNVTDGKITDFLANFSMDGESEPKHFHTVSNLIPLNYSLSDRSKGAVNLNPNGLTVINGSVDFEQTCHKKLTNIPVTIEIYPYEGKYPGIVSHIISITLDSKLIGNHFGTIKGGPGDGFIEGEVTSAISKDGPLFN